jgi:copper chaperone CopZ
METKALHVTGMSCGGCENAVTRSLLKVDGVSHVKASHADQRVDVTFDPARVDLSTLAARIEALGYHVAA